jgi:hypothetical protein
VGTTLRLWWRRRVLRLPDGARVGALRWSALTGVVVVLAAAVGVGIAAAGSGPVARPQKAVTPPPPTAAQLRTVANEQAASSWVAAQVDPSAQLGCDPSMCGYLTDAGVPTANDVVFSRGTAVPGAAAFVLATPVLRSQSGPALASGAPEVVASFGSGRERVDVLVAVSGPAAAFRQAALRAQHASAKLGKSLARSQRLKEALAARHTLISGLVDRRLLVVLKKMLAVHFLTLVGFGDPDPGASWQAPLRSMTIGGLVRRMHKHKVSNLAAELSLLRALLPPGTGSVQQITLPAGAMALVIQVPMTNSPRTG